MSITLFFFTLNIRPVWQPDHAQYLRMIMYDLVYMNCGQTMIMHAKPYPGYRLAGGMDLPVTPAFLDTVTTKTSPTTER